MKLSVAGALIVALILAALLICHPKSGVSLPRSGNRSVPVTIKESVVPEVKSALDETGSSSAPLKSAFKCAWFIADVQKSVPQERGTARHLLSGLQAALFINDYIMAAKTAKDSSLTLSNEAILQAFTNVASDVVFLKNNLATYSSFPESLSEHYERVRRNPQTKDQLAAIEQAIRDCGVVVDSQSDFLLDCIRLVCFRTEVDDMYGPRKSPLDNVAPNPQEAAACLQSFGKVFNYRFANKHGLTDATAQQLEQRLSQLTIEGLSPADLEVPVVLR